MPEIVGQKKLVALVDRWVRSDDMPAFLIVEAPKGHGKKLLAQYVADSLAFEIVSYGLKIEDARAMISDSQCLHTPRIYLFADADEMTVQAQNSILKTLEEPPRNAFIILTLENTSGILPTIVSRAKVLRMDIYNRDELKAFTDNEVILDICQNPGEIKSLSESFSALYGITEKIAANLSRTSAPNVFNILSYFQEEQYGQVVSLLIYHFNKNMMDMSRNRENWDHLCEALKVLYKYKAWLRNKGLNKRNLMENLFIELREAVLYGAGSIKG